MRNLELRCHAKFTADLNKLWSPELQNLLIWKVFIYTCKFFPPCYMYTFRTSFASWFDQWSHKRALGLLFAAAVSEEVMGLEAMKCYSTARKVLLRGAATHRAVAPHDSPQRVASPAQERFWEHHHSLLLPNSTPRGHQKRVKMR